MKTHRTYKFRIYPNGEQKQMFTRHFGSCRFVYNHFLRRRIDHYVETEKGLTYADMSKELTELKWEYRWLEEVTAQSLQQSLRNLDKAYNAFFRKQNKFPKFKSRRARQSFTVPQNFDINFSEGKIRLPKMGWVKSVLHRVLWHGTPKRIVITKAPSGKYHASIVMEIEQDPKPKTGSHEIGIDLGLKSFLVSSIGEDVPPPKFYRKSEKLLARRQRQLSRTKNGSKGREKARIKVAKVQEKIANRRHDFLHNLSRRLVDENQAIYVENLNVKGMVRNHSLAKSISDVGWGAFVQMLKYKGEEVGCYIGEVGRFYPSSKTCHHCRYVKQDLALSDRVWVCPKCWNILDRDVNAAINICRQGQMLRESRDLTTRS